MPTALTLTLSRRERGLNYNPPPPGVGKLPVMSLSSFSSTHWSLVLRAGRGGGEDSQAALAALCQRYWYPLYAFLRRKGISRERAEDLTQGFFTRLIDKQVLEQAEPLRGRFRSFLLTSLSNYMANEWDRDVTLKRGGGRPLLSLDIEAGELKLGGARDRELTPEKAFDRAWAIELLELVMSRLQQQFSTKGKTAQFDILRPFLAGDREEASYETAAADLGMSQPAVRQAVHRLRGSFRELLRQEVADTVSSEDEIDDEIRGLFAALGN